METQRGSRLGILITALLGAIALLSLFAVVISKHRENPPPPAKRSFGLEDKDILLYMEAIAKIRENGSFLKAGIAREEIVAESLKSYLSQIDIASDYLTREEYRRFKESQDDRYVGIGMEIKKERDGRILCLPYPDGPAAHAGIMAGDELKTINAIPVHGKSVFAVASIARGKPGSQVDLILTTRAGLEKQVKVRRSAVTTDSVSSHQFGKLRVMKIGFFSRDTKEKLKRLLKTWESGQPIIMDLRGNAGGDLHAAIDAAMLFLSRGKRIASIQARDRAKTFDANGGAENGTSPLYLWQDEATASAAEVFIAALTENNRAVSIGQKTFGKGTVQDIIELSDGSAMILTTGLLKTPRGVSYDRQGLAPTFAISGDTTLYVRKVEELARARSNVHSE
jgi:carboxyl-terminal processing protease